MSDVIAQEGDTVTLWCMSSGTPTPQVTWYQCSHQSRHACSSSTETGFQAVSLSLCLSHLANVLYAVVSQRQQ